MAFELPKLPYTYRALAPHIDVQTMELHHDKHHRAYVNNLNKATASTGLDDRSMTSMLESVSQYGPAVRNNGGGHYNHSLFWSVLSPEGGGVPAGKLADAIHECFGGFDAFKEAFSASAATHFGSGWAWLYANERGELAVCATPNQDNPLMDVAPAEHRGTPLLGLDVWEHAYYLRYQNRRAEYIAAFWHVVDWRAVAQRLQQVLR